MSTATVSTVTAFSQLEKSTVALLDAAFKLKEHKEYYDHEEYLALLKANGWKYGGTEEKRLLAVATAFNPFMHCIQKLSKIEPKTIYQLADEKLAPVITRIQNTPSITQDLVVKFIRHQQNLLRKQKNGMAREGWKYRKNGRFYRVELIEEGDWTGRAIEALRQKGHATTEIVRNAMQLLVQQEGWEVEIAEDSDNQEAPVVEEENVLEPVQVTPGAIPTCFQNIEEDIEEKLFNELLIEFKLCKAWTNIRNVLYCCNAVTRSSAWNELSQDERKKVWAEMPEMTRELARAKKEGVIRDYREQLCGKKYEIYTWDDDAPFIVNALMVERALTEIAENLSNQN
ncbi:hypothetical protein CAL7716_101290 (plasmid) [Calothrix sp. PCC 7716]|nr:hypothetical protein CAL7716_101290 [Calothrix sp. PCC 7716]